MKQAAVINDLSGFGKCSLTAAVAVLSVMKISPCCIPTAVLSAQTGFEDFFCHDLSDILPKYTERYKKDGQRFDGLLSGYTASEAQLDHICEFLDAFANVNTVTLVDPIMGDGGKLYPTYTRTMCKKMRELTKRADIVTPNLTELCVLTDTDYSQLAAHSESRDYLDRIEAAARRGFSQDKTVIVTGIHSNESIHNLIIEKGSSEIVSSKRREGSFSGTGDIFASIVLGGVMNGRSAAESAKTAAEFIGRAIDITDDPPEYGVEFEPYLTWLGERFK